MRQVIAPANMRLGFALIGALFGIVMLGVSGSFAATSMEKATPAEKTVIYESRAFDLETGALLYSERHVYNHIDDQPVTATVSYLTPDGDEWAIKKLSFATGAATPFFHRQNFKSGYQEGFENRADGTSGLLFHQKAGDERQCKKPVAVDQSFVVDAGFNQYLQAHLADLDKGDELRFGILVPKACRALEFEAKAVPSSDPLLVTIHMQPTNFLARLVVPKTQVRYNRESGALVDYRGLSDLTDDQGRTMRVEIKFAPPQVTTAEVDSHVGTNRSTYDRKQRDGR